MATLTEEREREGSQIMTFNLKNNHEGMMVVARIILPPPPPPPSLPKEPPAPEKRRKNQRRRMRKNGEHPHPLSAINHPSSFLFFSFFLLLRSQ